MTTHPTLAFDFHFGYANKPDLLAEFTWRIRARKQLEKVTPRFHVTEAGIYYLREADGVADYGYLAPRADWRQRHTFKVGERKLTITGYRWSSRASVMNEVFGSTLIDATGLALDIEYAEVLLDRIRERNSGLEVSIVEDQYEIPGSDANKPFYRISMGLSAEYQVWTCGVCCRAFYSLDLGAL